MKWGAERLVNVFEQSQSLEFKTLRHRDIKKRGTECEPTATAQKNQIS